MDEPPLLTSEEIIGLVNQGRKLLLNSQSSKSRQTGIQASEALGHGMDFADSRSYQIGDNPNRIDWRVSARRQQTMIRLYHDENIVPTCVVIDRKSTMRFGTQVRTKAAQAARVAIMLIVASLDKGIPVSVMLLGGKQQWITQTTGNAALQKIINAITAACPLTDEADLIDWQQTSSELQRHLSQGSRLYLISDFLSMSDDHLSSVQQLGRSYRCSAVQIIDAIEKQNPQTMGVVLQWADRYLKPVEAIGQWVSQQRQWQENLFRILKSSRMKHVDIVADIDLLTPSLQKLN